MSHNVIQLPQLQAVFSQTIPKHVILMVTGGQAPEPDWLHAAAANRKIWCIDHGLDCCYQAKLLPQLLLGDGDSASPEAWQWAMDNQIPIEQHPCDKDDTDSQLAFAKAQTENSFIILTGAMGGRFDHAFSTIFTLGHSRLQGCIADNREAIFFLRGNDSLELIPSCQPKAISLLPLTTSAAGVSFEGVKWPLHHATLNQGYPYAISNVPRASKMKVSLEKGIIAVYLCWSAAETK